MPLRERVARGTEYLDLVTRLLQRTRRVDPTGGLWEAADLQWWWRRDRPSDRDGQLFWLDDNLDPVAAVVLTDWGRTWACDVIVAPGLAGSAFGIFWQSALERMAALGLDAVEIAARDDDAAMLAALAASGFLPTGDGGTTTWLDAADRPDVTAPPPGFRLTSRADTGDRPHHLVRRNDELVARRLAECTLYDPELDLLIEAPGGDVAAYCVFWRDSVTGVGLVEPLRTEASYRRLGLARCLLTTGLNRLAAGGSQRFKVSYEAGNPAARDLYLGAGFKPESTAQVFRRGLA